MVTLKFFIELDKEWPRAGVGKHFLRRAACSYYIYYIYNHFKTLKKFYMSYHKMKVTIVTSSWVKTQFRMKRVEKTWQL